MTQGTLRAGAWIKHQKSYYSPSQVAQYLDVIGLPDLLGAPTSLENLTKIVRGHLLNFPFENTAMHYSKEHEMDVTPEGAFHRFVVERNGSYCFGQNGVLLGVLRGLGYRAYAVSARVNESSTNQPNYTPLTHMVLLIQPLDSNTTYLVDVGFGSNGLARPILLGEGEEVMGVSPSERHRLARGELPESSLESTPGSGESTDVKWSLQVRHSHSPSPSNSTSSPPNAEWKTLYSFSEEEFFTRDAIAANFIVSQMYVPDGLFCNHVVCVKHFVVGDNERELLGLDPAQNEQQNDEPVYLSRLVLLGNQIKKHIGPNTILIRTLNSEKERILALKELFGIYVGDVEEAVECVKGRKPALNSDLE